MLSLAAAAPKNLALTFAEGLDDLMLVVCRVQVGSTGSAAWVPSYQVAGETTFSSSTADAPERRAPSAGELSMIHSLQGQLKSVHQELKGVTATVAVH
jgi:hypothetical protein